MAYIVYCEVYCKQSAALVLINMKNALSKATDKCIASPLAVVKVVLVTLLQSVRCHVHCRELCLVLPVTFYGSFFLLQ